MRALLKRYAKFGFKLAVVVWIVFSHSAALGADKIAAAKKLVVTLYPQIAESGMSLIIRDGTPLGSAETLNLFTLELRPSPTHHELDDTLCKPALLYAGFKFPHGTVDDRIFELHIEGPFVNRDRREALSRLVDLHEEWYRCSGD